MPQLLLEKMSRVSDRFSSGDAAGYQQNKNEIAGVGSRAVIPPK